MYYYSKYNVDFNDGNNVIIVNLLTGALVSFDSNEFEALKKLQIEENFSAKTISELLDMWIICEEKDEVAYIKSHREDQVGGDNEDVFHLTILTTSECNARCYYCYEHGMKREEMSMDTACQIVEYIKDNHANKTIYINWFGGEPLYNEAIISFICQELKNASIKYESTITTNAYLFDRYLDRAIHLWNLQRAQITIDAVGEEYNKIKNYIYDDENAFDRVIDNVEKLLQSDIAVNIRLNFDPRSLNDTINTIKYLHSRFGNTSKLIVYPGWIISPNVPTFMDYASDQNPYLKLLETLLYYGYITELEDLGIWPSMFGCGAFMDHFAVIGTDGNLFKCEHGVLDGTAGAYGNIWDGITNLQNLDEWKNTDYPYQECEICQSLPICQGGCKYRAMTEPQKYVCLPIKNCVKEAVELFYKKFYKEGDCDESSG